MLGADTRSTSGSTVADKNCEKIHYIAPNIYCCGAGTAADTENVTGMVSSALELHRYGTGRQSRVVTAMTLLKSHLFRWVQLRAWWGGGVPAIGCGHVACMEVQLWTGLGGPGGWGRWGLDCPAMMDCWS